jgi:hypothetical protein
MNMNGFDINNEIMIMRQKVLENNEHFDRLFNEAIRTLTINGKSNNLRLFIHKLQVAAATAANSASMIAKVLALLDGASELPNNGSVSGSNNNTSVVSNVSFEGGSKKSKVTKKKPASDKKKAAPKKKVVKDKKKAVPKKKVVKK